MNEFHGESNFLPFAYLPTLLPNYPGVLVLRPGLLGL